MIINDANLILTALWLDEFRFLSKREIIAFETIGVVYIDCLEVSVIISTTKYGIHSREISKVWFKSGKPDWMQDVDNYYEWKDVEYGLVKR